MARFPILMRTRSLSRTGMTSMPGKTRALRVQILKSVISATFGKAVPGSNPEAPAVAVGPAATLVLLCLGDARCIEHVDETGQRLDLDSRDLQVDTMIHGILLDRRLSSRFGRQSWKRARELEVEVRAPQPHKPYQPLPLDGGLLASCRKLRCHIPRRRLAGAPGADCRKEPRIGPARRILEVPNHSRRASEAEQCLANTPVDAVEASKHNPMTQ
jgi:hypothetical protein